MSFNQGWLCKECGPVKESKKRSINKTQYDCCKACGGIVTKWTRPMNERAGRCNNCGHAAFKLAMGKNKLAGRLLRCCTKCQEVVNTDDNNKILVKGNEAFKYERV